jgi:hypothetical protein
MDKQLANPIPIQMIMLFLLVLDQTSFLVLEKAAWKNQ